MLHVLTEDQKLIQSAAKEFVEKEVAPVAQKMDEDDEFPYELMKRCGELGFTGIVLPEEYGGSGLGLTEFALVLEEISRESQTLAICLDASSTLCFLPILMSGTEEQRKKYLPRAAKGEIIGAYSMTEPVGAGFFFAYSTKAVKQGNEWVLNGTKIFCTNSEAADVYIVYALVDDNPMPTAFLVDKDTPGVEFGNKEKKLGWHGSYTGTVNYVDVHLPAGAVLGELHGALQATIIPIFESCIGIGAMCCGAAAGVFEKTFDYVHNRDCPAGKIDSNQSVQQDLARAAMEIETSRALVYKTAGMVDAGSIPIPNTPTALLASACKVIPPEMAERVTDLCIQLHGGHGYIDDMGIHRYWRDVRACQIGEGPTWQHLGYVYDVLVNNPNLI
ncbi:MAG: acyl-CoA dehydrogenase family protein [Coriobacteriales bacterium]|jgi:alkylation response protein AidB-like acyl-CoA dehydrogenase